MDLIHNTLILLSADNESLYRNYKKTVKSQVKVSLLQKFYRKFKKHNIPSKVSVWGLNPTKDNKQIWESTKPKDIVLFYRKGKFFSKGYIYDKFRSKDLPSKLWDNPLFGKSWQYILLIHKLEPTEIDFASTLSFFVRPTMPNAYTFPIKKIEDDKLRILVSNFGSLEQALISLSKLDIRKEVPVISEIDSLRIPRNVKFKLKTRIANYRVGQEGFNKNVLSNYGNMCAVCDMDETELLEASHIMPVSEQEFGGLLENGICMCVLHHTMFDRGYFSFDNDYRVIISQQKKITHKIKALIPEGESIRKAKTPPSKEFLALHRAKFNFNIKKPVR